MLKKKIIQSLMFIAFGFLAQTANADIKNKSNTNCNYIQLQTTGKLQFRAYTAGPKTAKQGVLLIHGWWGLNKEIETWANKFAMSGYRVVAIDLFNNKVTTSPATARQLIKSVNQSEANEKYIAALEYLSQPGRKLAIIGRSYGAAQALQATLAAPNEVSATVMYYPYGNLVSDMQKLKTIKRPVLGHFAEHDFFLTTDKRNQFTAKLKNSGIKMSVNIYDARHGFDKPTSKNFDEPAQKASWQKSRQFLNKYLQ